MRVAPAMKVPWARQARLDIVLLILAAAAFLTGLHLLLQPAERTDIEAYNRGVAAYLKWAKLPPSTDDITSDYSIIQAAGYFRQAALESTDIGLKSSALYNLGTMMGEDALATNGQTPSFGVLDAINHLAEAVRLDPDNESAKYNLELFEALLPDSVNEQLLSDLLLINLTPAPGFFLGSIDKGL
jgi:hypothetical protein